MPAGRTCDREQNAAALTETIGRCILLAALLAKHPILSSRSGLARTRTYSLRSPSALHVQSQSAKTEQTLWSKGIMFGRDLQPDWLARPDPCSFTGS